MTSDYYDQWRQLLIHFSVNEELAATTFEKIMISYGEVGRYYHTLEHIAHVLRTAAKLQHLATDYPAIQLAGWLHDIVYDPHQSDNEAQSVIYAESLMKELNLPSDQVKKVTQMILSTANHQNPTNEMDINILLDADLAILGSDEKNFRRYCEAIRQEYISVDETVYAPARMSILQKFLQRPRIYNTEPLYQRLEIKARNNLLAEINRLS